MTCSESRSPLPIWSVHALAALFLAAPVGACAAVGDTSIGVVVSESDPGLDVRLERIELEVSVFDPRAARWLAHRSYAKEPGFDAAGRLQAWATTVRPVNPSDTRTYRFRAVGIVAGTEHVAAQARLAFLPGERLVLPLRLDRACVGLACRDDQTCVGGACRDDYVPPCSIVPDGLRSGDCGTSEDAAIGPPDADAARADTGPLVGCVVIADCDDGNPCTLDRCVAGWCVRDELPCPDDGNACTAEACDPVAGVCIAPAVADGTACGGAGRCCSGRCVDTSSDPASCGACGNVCGVGSSCAAGACACLGGLQDCDGLPGCESDPRIDPSSCGRCGLRCGGATPSCLGGSCGACSAASDCPDDGLGCTDPPSCDGGICSLRLRASTCLISGACFDAGARNPANECEECDTARSQTAWSNRAGSCNDGMYCTEPDTCSGGACGGPARGCASESPCTMAICDEGADVCRAMVRPDRCQIGGVCYAAGQPDGANACRECDPARSQTAWSDRAGPCDDGLYCTEGDSCTAGTCTAGVARVCPANPCTVATCNEAADRCDYAPNGAGCWIGGQCVATGQRDPANDCRQCIPTTSSTSWSNRTGACDDGAYCTINDTCSAGTCSGVARDCNGVSCTLPDWCDEATDSCRHDVRANRCLIGPACYVTGERAGDDCSYCDPSWSQTMFRPLPNGAGCGGDLGICCGAVCRFSDPANCGMCGAACAPGDICNVSYCSPPG